MMTDELLAEIRKRVAAATPAPWSLDFTDDDFNVRPDNASHLRGGGALSGNITPETLVASIDYAPRKDDLMFIQYAREDIPALLEEIDRLQGLIDKFLRDQPNFHWHE